MTTPAPSPALVARTAHIRPVPVPEQRHRRGDVWMVVSDPSSPAVGNEIWSDRPAIIVSNNVLNARSGVAQVVYLSTATRKRTGPTHVEVPAVVGGGTAMALCEQVHTVDASRLRRRLGVLPEDSIREIDTALALSLSIGRNPNTHSAFRKWEEHIKLHGIDLAKEIDALAGTTADQRVEALSRALRNVAIERDAYRNLYESLPKRGSALDDVEAALSGRRAA